ncbi:MarR family transcriptional regulator [Lachnospiraceae bacterium 62-35]
MDSQICERQEMRELNQIYKEMEDLYHDIAIKLGISDSVFDILYDICELGDGCLQKDICRMSFSSKQTINSAIQKLKGDGYLYLKPGKGKDKHIFLTEIGRQFVEENIIPVFQIENLAFHELSHEESQELLRLSGKYLKQFREKVSELL